MMTQAEFWRPVRELLSEESRWTQQFVARDASGLPCGIKNESAVCWCLHGAALKIQTTVDAYNYWPYDEFISRFNDSHTYQEVIARLDNLIDGPPKEQE